MKRTVSLLLIILMILSFCGCKDSQKVFAFVHCYEEDAYTSALAEGFCSTAQQLGYACEVIRPEDDSLDAQTQLIARLIREGIHGIALNPGQVEGLEEVLAEAQDAGIPVVTVSRDTRGSDLLIQPSSTELVGAALMDAMLELTGGDGEFVVLSGETPFSGADPWVSGMKVAAQGSKYSKLTWTETNYSYRLNDGVEGMKNLIVSLLDKYPGLEVICCPGAETLVACCQAVEALDANLRVTGLSRPARMQGLIGEDRACPYFFLWNPKDIGACAANALDALAKGAALREGGTLITDSGEYRIYTGAHAECYLYAGPPFRFTAEHMANNAIY